MSTECHRLTRDTLHGVWAAITTPFTEQDRFDEETFRENIRRLHAAGVHGIYTTDADGEFYAIELDEFRQIIDVFADETQRLGVSTQVGVSWINAAGIEARLRHAAARGILGAHVGHPTYMPMSAASLAGFWRSMQAAVPEEFALIHYNTPRMPNYLHGPDYARLAAEIPSLIGTKHVGGDVPEFLTLMAEAPMLSHFTGEHAFTPFALFGARGIYSWFVNFNPRYVLDWYDAILAGRWQEARDRQVRMHAFMRASELLHQDGNLHGIIGKAVSAASPFLRPANRTRRPYLAIPDDLVRRFQRIVDEQFPDLTWTG